MRSHVLAVLSFALAACQTAAAAGDPCVRDAQCGASLVCALGRCREACRSTRDCAPTERCLVEPSTGLSACSLSRLDDCTTTACAPGLACRDGACVNLCGDVVACPDGVCVDSICVARRDPVDASLPSGDAGDAAGDAPSAPDAGTDCHGPGCDPVVSVSVASDDVYATTASGAAWAWGSAVHGQLGDGLVAHPGCDDCALTPVRILDPSGQPFADVAEARGGGNFGCLRQRSGAVWCWGRGYAGQLGDGLSLDTLDRVRVLRESPSGPIPIDDASALFVAGNSSCVLRGPDHEAWCWGDGPSGRLGTGDARVAAVAVQATELGTDLVAIETANLHTHALARDGTIRAVGHDLCCVVGSGVPDSDVLHAVTTPLRATSLATNALIACAIDTAGALRCWGEQAPMFGGAAGAPPFDGSAGLCYLACTPTPQVMATPPGHPFVRLFGHSNGTFLALDPVGRLYALNGSQEEPYDALPFPVAVASDRRFVEASVERTACAVTREGDLFCWGAEDHGQLGRGRVSTLYEPTPTSVWP
ncbi:MAG: hypothetical protein U0234_10245 [Sandaracinus sp.]